jgi:hypothetical protein
MAETTVKRLDRDRDQLETLDHPDASSEFSARRAARHPFTRWQMSLQRDNLAAHRVLQLPRLIGLSIE